jgi:hypothetical protein
VPSSFRADNTELTGSLTEVSSGVPYIIGGTGIDVTTGSNGQITITGTGGGGSGTITGVTAGDGLTGGGVTGIVTLNAIAGTGISVAANSISTNDSQINHDDLQNFKTTKHVDHTGVTISAGAGLTGGGDITTSRTIDIGQGTGIIVNTNDIAVNTAYVPNLTGTNTFTGNNTFNNTTIFQGGALAAEVELANANLFVTGSSYFNGDVSINEGDRLRLNNPGDNDQYINATANQMNIYADTLLQINSDEQVRIDVSNLTEDDTELIRLSAGASSVTLKPSKLQINQSYSDSDFLVGGSGESNQGLIYVDAADTSILFGAQNLGYGEFGGVPTTNRPADIAADIGYGDDVKILLSGSAGSKDSTTRGVTLVTGDLVVSGNLYTGDTYKTFTKGHFYANYYLSAATKDLYYASVSGNGLPTTSLSGKNLLYAKNDINFESLGITTSTSGKLNAKVGLTGSIYYGSSTSMTLLESVKIDLTPGTGTFIYEIPFSGSYIPAGNMFAVSIEPAFDWGTSGGADFNITGTYSILNS